MIILKKLKRKSFFINKHIFSLLVISLIYRSILTLYYLNLFNFSGVTTETLMNFLKFIIAICFFFLGKTLTNEEWSNLIRAYVYTSILIGVLVIFQSIFNTSILSVVMFSGVRGKGFMNDPNYFSMLQLLSLIFVDRELSRKKNIYNIILILSILLSGSKLALVTLIILLMIIYFKKLNLTLKNLIIIILTTFVFIFTFRKIYLGIINYQFNNFSLNRLQDFLIHRDLNSGGSDRGIVWRAALDTIKYTDGLGMGFGFYLPIVEKISGVRLLAHNTYLQIIAEWGIPISLLFFYKIVQRYLLKYLNKMLTFEENAIIIVLMTFSLAISLQNSRIFWLFLAYSLKNNNKLLNEKE